MTAVNGNVVSLKIHVLAQEAEKNSFLRNINKVITEYEMVMIKGNERMKTKSNVN